MDEVTDADWNEIEKLIGNLSYEVMTPMIGLVMPILTADVPVNMLLCDGATYDRVDYPNLYAALDTAFIVDADTFIVPDLRSRVPIGAGAGAGLTEYDVGETGGEEFHQLTEAELAEHVHTYSAPDLSVLVVAPGEVAVPAFDFLANFTGATGGDVPHENRQPFVAMRYGVIAW